MWTLPEESKKTSVGRASAVSVVTTDATAPASSSAVLSNLRRELSVTDFSGFSLLPDMLCSNRSLQDQKLSLSYLWAVSRLGCTMRGHDGGAAHAGRRRQTFNGGNRGSDLSAECAPKRTSPTPVSFISSRPRRPPASSTPRASRRRSRSSPALRLCSLPATAARDNPLPASRKR